MSTNFDNLELTKQILNEKFDQKGKLIKEELKLEKDYRKDKGGDYLLDLIPLKEY